MKTEKTERLKDYIIIVIICFYFFICNKKAFDRNKRNKNKKNKELYNYCLSLLFNVCFMGN